MKMQVLPSSELPESLYPISPKDRIGDFSILHKYTPSVIRAIKRRYHNLLQDDDPIWYLHELHGRPELEDQDDKRFGYRLGVIAARIVVNEKLLKLGSNIGELRLNTPGRLPDGFTVPANSRYPLRQFYAPDGSVDIKAEFHQAVSHMLPEQYSDDNDWPAIGMGDTHALYGVLRDSSMVLKTEPINPTTR